MRLPPLSEPAPFTVAATVRGASMLAFPAENPGVAAEIAWGLSDRHPSTAPRWGPSATHDGQPWPVAMLVRDSETVHLCLTPAGFAVPAGIPTGCGRVVAVISADFSGSGRPCEVCLTYWQVAYGQVERRAVGRHRALT